MTSTLSEGPTLPDTIPTGVAIAVLKHVLDHGHDGLDPVDHFRGALIDVLGLAVTDPELAAAEEAVVLAMTSHPRDQAAIDAAMDKLRISAYRLQKRSKTSKRSR